MLSGYDSLHIIVMAETNDGMDETLDLNDAMDDIEEDDSETDDSIDNDDDEGDESRLAGDGNRHEADIVQEGEPINTGEIQRFLDIDSL